MASPLEDAPLSTAALLPKRSPGLISRIANLFVKQQPYLGPQPDQKETTQTGVVSQSLTNVWDSYFRAAAERLGIYKDVEEMDRVSEEVSVALDTIADNLVTSEDGVEQSFTARSENDRVQEVLDDTVESCDLHHGIRAIARNLVKYGDYFGEIVVNGERRVVKLKTLPPQTIYRNEDAFGNLLLTPPKYAFDKTTKTVKVLNKRGECAFEQVTDDQQDMVAAFFPWQIVQARLRWDGTSRYGRSHLQVSRIIWKKLKAIEEALIIGRLTRDLLKLIFYVDTTGLSPDQRQVVLSEFRNNVTTRQNIDGRRENPYRVMTDFFLSTGYVRVGGDTKASLTKLDVIDPKNEGLHQIADVEYLHRKLLVTTRVPPAHMGFEKEAQPGILTSQDVQYVRMLRTYQQVIGCQVLEQIFDIALILQGIDPRDPANSYDIVWPSLKAVNEVEAANTALAEAQADQLYMQEGVVDAEYVQEHRLGLDEEGRADLNDRIDRARQEQQDAEFQQQKQLASLQPPTTGAGGGGPTSGRPGGAAGPAQGSAKAKNPSAVNPSGPRDRDGRRKGDEGRDRNGNRIPASKSKKGKPTGRKKTLNSEAARLLAAQMLGKANFGIPALVQDYSTQAVEEGEPEMCQHEKHQPQCDETTGLCVTCGCPADCICHTEYLEPQTEEQEFGRLMNQLSDDVAKLVLEKLETETPDDGE